MLFSSLRLSAMKALLNSVSGQQMPELLTLIQPQKRWRPSTRVFAKNIISIDSVYIFLLLDEINSIQITTK